MEAPEPASSYYYQRRSLLVRNDIGILPVEMTFPGLYGPGVSLNNIPVTPVTALQVFDGMYQPAGILRRSQQPGRLFQ